MHKNEKPELMALSEIASINITEDITERKRLEQELEEHRIKLEKSHEQLKESEERYRDLFENAADPMYVNSADGYILDINRAGIEKLCCSAKEEIIGTHASRWFTPESWRLTQETILKRISGEPADDPMIRQIVTKSGECRWAEIRSRLIKSGDHVVGFQGIARDITEKMELLQKVKDYQNQLERSYEDIKKSEEKYRELFENASDMFLISDKDGYVLDINNATVKALGCKEKNEVIGTHFSEWYTPESIKIAQNNQKKYISGEPVKQPQIHEFVCKNGEHKWAEVRSRIIYEGDRAVALHAIARDITEKLRLEEKLKESEALYKDLFENADDPMYTHDLKGYLLTVNKIGLKMLGGTEEEIIGSHISKWLTPESYKIFEDRVRRIYLNQPIEQPVIIEVITRNGEHRWGEARTRLIKDGNRITGVHGIVREITDKMKLEMALRVSEAQYRELFENASDCIYTINLDGQFLTANNSVAKAMKCTSVEEVLASNMSRWMTPESLEKAIKFIQEVITEEDYYNKSVVIEIIRKDGKHVWFEHKARPLKDNKNKIIGLHGIGRDITEKIRLEQELKESEAKYRELFENAQDAMYVLDTGLNFLKMNQAGLRILDCTKEEIIGSNISKWLTKESLSIVEERGKKWASGEIVTQIDTIELVCKSGEHRWVDIKTRHIKDGDRTIEIHGIARDVTENMRLKQELNRSNKQRKLLCYLIEGTRGGKTRALILKHLNGRSYNAHQLAKALNMDYKTVRHHLGVLVKNGIITSDNGGYTALYFISKNMELDINEFNSQSNGHKS